jgi:hypothetical protein
MKKIALLILFGTLLNISIAADHLSHKHGITRLNVNDESSKITLKLGDKTYDIQTYNLSFRRNRNKEKTESASIDNYNTNTISITIRSNKLDQEFMDWLFAENQQPKDGQIIVYDADSGKTKTITFTGATTSSYNEGLNVANALSNSRTTIFGLRYKTVSIKI